MWQFMNKYERLKELEAKKSRYERLFKEWKGYDYVVLCKHPHKKAGFFEQKENTKRVSGIPQILDVPDTLNLLTVINEIITEDYNGICKEFANLQKDL